MQVGLEVRDDDVGVLGNTSRHNTSRSASGAASDRFFSGLPGDTIHQTLSSPSRFSATSLIMRWAACGRIEGPAEQADGLAGEQRAGGVP